MCNNLLPMNPVNPDRKHRRHAKGWKATSKRCHQYHRTPYITCFKVDLFAPTAETNWKYVDMVFDPSMA